MERKESSSELTQMVVAEWESEAIEMTIDAMESAAVDSVSEELLQQEEIREEESVEQLSQMQWQRDRSERCVVVHHFRRLGQ